MSIISKSFLCPFVMSLSPHPHLPIAKQPLICFLSLQIHIFWSFRQMESHHRYALLSGFFEPTIILRFIHIIAYINSPWFWLLSSVPVYGYLTIWYSIQLLMDIWALKFPICGYWGEKKLLWAFMSKSLYGHIFSFSWANTYAYKAWITWYVHVQPLKILPNCSSKWF